MNDPDFAPFLAVGALGAIDAHVARTLGSRLGELRGDVLLAVALAVRAPQHGHVCVDLRGVELAALVPERRDDEPVDLTGLALPPDRDAWRARVAVSPLVRETEVGSTPFVLRDGLLYADRYFHYETVLRDAFRRRLAESRTVGDPALLARGLDALFAAPPDGSVDLQRQAALAALTRGAVVISGGPGTGKTWTVRNVLTLLFAQWAASAPGTSPPRVAVAAPTGKAAARVVESIRAGLTDHVERARRALPSGVEPAALASFLSDLPPWTIHRLLGYNRENPTRFRHDAERPLAFDVVLIDEASMVDVALMAKLVDAVPAGARLVLLGDRHQLASVEAGTVLADLCGVGDLPAPHAAVVFLTRSRRYAPDSGIARLAAATLAGDEGGAVDAVPTWPASGPGSLVVDARGDVVGRDIGRLPPTPTGGLPASVRGLVVAGYRSALERLKGGLRAGEDLPTLHRDVLGRFDRFRVLAAHRRGSLGVETLNEAIEEWLRDEGLLTAIRNPWYLGRPVMIRRNDYGVRRFNGDVGLVVRGPDSDPIVVFPGSDGGVEYLAPVRLPDHETVFAMTIHKSQGSEFDDVLVVLPDQPSPILTRELVYTGATRARKRLTLLAQPEVLASAVRRPVQRASGLAERLWTPT